MADAGALEAVSATQAASHRNRTLVAALRIDPIPEISRFLAAFDRKFSTALSAVFF